MRDIATKYVLRDRYPQYSGDYSMRSVPWAILGGTTYGNLGITNLATGSDWKVVSGTYSLPAAVHGPMRTIYPLDGTLLISTIVSRRGYLTKYNPNDNSFNVVLDMGDSSWADVWSITHHQSKVFAGAYGARGTAQSVYISEDSGDNWSHLINIDAGPTHIHKVLYDHYEDVLWISQGDYSYAKLFKVDGPNYNTKVEAIAQQPTAGILTEDYILWGSDSYPTGVLRYNKTTEAFDWPLNFTENHPKYDDFIFTMYKDTDGYIYAGTSGGSNVENIGVFMGHPPDYSQWELICNIDIPIATYNGFRHIVGMVGNELLAVFISGAGNYKSVTMGKYPVV